MVLQPFQRGMLQDMAALEGLFQQLVTEEPTITFLLTRRLNQDDFERLFGIIRMTGRGGNAHPSKTEFVHRLKGLLLGKGCDNY